MYVLGIEIELTSIKQGPKELRNECDVALGTFKIGYLNVQLVNAKVSSIEKKLQELCANEVTLLLGEVPEEDTGILFNVFLLLILI